MEDQKASPGHDVDVTQRTPHHDSGRMDRLRLPNLHVLHLNLHQRRLRDDSHLPVLWEVRGKHQRGHLAALVEHTITKNGHRDQVTAIVTDCEHSMVKVVRILSAKKVAEHIGCAGHRLKSPVVVVIENDVKHTPKNAPSTVGRY